MTSTEPADNIGRGRGRLVCVLPDGRLYCGPANPPEFENEDYCHELVTGETD